MARPDAARVDASCHFVVFLDSVGLITTAETAVILKVSPVRVRQLIRDGQLRSEKRGRDHLLDRDEVERFNRDGRRPGGRPKKLTATKHLRVR